MLLIQIFAHIAIHMYSLRVLSISVAAWCTGVCTSKTVHASQIQLNAKCNRMQVVAAVVVAEAPKT